MPVTCIFGMQWGDEGKGRVVDLLAAQADVVVRFQGGSNAGHTVVVGSERYVLHLLPSGVIQPRTTNVIANGVVVDPATLVKEIDELAARGIDLDGRLLLSDRAHVVLPYHRLMDQAMERLRGSSALGTTSRGIGPAYGDKATREGLRVADLMATGAFEERFLANVAARNEILERVGIPTLDATAALEELHGLADRLRPYVADTAGWLLEAFAEGREMVLEGAQGFALDVDHGSYPFVTSSSTGVGSVSAGTGLPPRAIERVVGVIKAYSTRVGAGPFPTRAAEAPARHLATRGHEFGATTGRPRDCGWFDAVVARRAASTQGVDTACLMKLDVLSGLEELQVGVGYELDGQRVDTPPALAAAWAACRPVYETFPGWEADLAGVRRFADLPQTARTYVRALQDLMGVPIEMISVGAERDRFIRTERGVPVGA